MLGFGSLGVLWIVSGVLALVAIRAGRVQQHKQWMIRNYALSYAAVMLRIYLPLGLASPVGFDGAYPAIAWMCWVPNLILVEWLLLSKAPLATHGGTRARAELHA